MKVFFRKKDTKSLCIRLLGTVAMNTLTTAWLYTHVYVYIYVHDCISNGFQNLMKLKICKYY